MPRPTGRLFIDDELESDTQLALPAAQAHYVGRVLRLGAGDALVLFDGRGGEFAGTVSEVAKKGVVLAVGAKRAVERESQLSIRLVQGISRGERMDFVVRKATELGVARITPVLSEHSVVKLDRKRRDSRVQHWTGIARSACEQCGRNRIPSIDEPRLLREYLADAGGTDGGGTRIVLQPSSALSLARLEASPTSAEVLIGPEGGLSDQELERIDASGFIACSLGPRILRTETAAIAAITVLQARWGDFAGG